MLIDIIHHTKLQLAAPPDVVIVVVNVVIAIIGTVLVMLGVVEYQYNVTIDIFY